VVEFTRILCPMDLSESSVRPLTYAAALARWYEAKLTVLYVAPTFDPMLVRSAALDGAPFRWWTPHPEKIFWTSCAVSRDHRCGIAQRHGCCGNW
jgi:nucleotide-binding universal stress UspA family protein